MLLGMYIGGLHSRIERVENTLDRHVTEMTELRQSVQTLSTSLEGRLDTREVSIEGMEGVLVRLVALEATLSSLSKEMGTTKHAVSASVKAMKSETGKMRTEMQKISAPRDDGISKIIKEASAKEARKQKNKKSHRSGSTVLGKSIVSICLQRSPLRACLRIPTMSGLDRFGRCLGTSSALECPEN